MPATTTTGSFRIGFRRGWSEWQKSLPALIAWAKAQQFAAIDVGPLPKAELETITAAGLHIGTIDLPQPWGGLVSADAGKRAATADAIAAYAASVVGLCKHFFTVVIPEDHAAKRSDNMARAVDG